VSHAGDEDDEDPIFAPPLFAPPEGLAVRIMDLSGGNGAEPVETIRGFLTIEHANAFARRYVRDSLELCRAGGLKADAVLSAWFAYGEDAEVEGAGDDAWRSANELHDFAARAPRDAEERNWRALDPRRDAAAEEAAEED
jgi:hypothetical protein